MDFSLITKIAKRVGSNLPAGRPVEATVHRGVLRIRIATQQYYATKPKGARWFYPAPIAV